MSSPIAKRQKSGVDNALVATHQRLSHGHRIELLAEAFAARILKLADRTQGRQIRILDVGCGDMTLADAIGAKINNAEIRCVDIHPFPTDLAKDDPRWRRYSSFDGQHLEFDEQSFDVVMFADVVHHVPAGFRTTLLASAGRVGSFVVIKDHFEYGWWSRQSLRAMDFVGNFGYGVSVPASYFDRERFQTQCSAAALCIEEIEVGLQLYDHLPLVRKLLSTDWQFMAVCRRNKASSVGTVQCAQLCPDPLGSDA